MADARAKAEAWDHSELESQQARIAELEQALRGILHEWDAKSITGRRFTEAIEAARKALEKE